MRSRYVEIRGISLCFFLGWGCGKGGVGWFGREGRRAEGDKCVFWGNEANEHVCIG